MRDAPVTRWIKAWHALSVTALTVAAYPGASLASHAPCDSVPLCEPQVMSPVLYSGWETSGWAYYCTGDHPYYWNNSLVLGLGNNFDWDNSCFSVIEDPFAEGEPSKFDATITNWCINHQSITMTIGCSQQPQFAPACANGVTVISDPGCPMQGSPANHCTGNPPFCFQTWRERCSNVDQPYCTADAGLVWCTVCD